jgi:hypothetical protein
MATAPPRLPSLQVTVTDGTVPLAGLKVYCGIPGRTGGTDMLGPITTSAKGVARFEPPPGLTSAQVPGVKIRIGKHEKNIAWQAFYEFVVPPPWWKRVWNWILGHLPKTATGWAAAALLAVAAVYVVVCGVSAAAFGRDPLGYNARCARMAVEAAAAPAKPSLAVPQGHDARPVPVALETDVPQLFSNRVHVTFASDSRRAVPSAGGSGSADGVAYSDAWAKYDEALRKAAAQGKIPSAIECPLQEIAALSKFIGALSGKDDTK